MLAITICVSFLENQKNVYGGEICKVLPAKFVTDQEPNEISRPFALFAVETGASAGTSKGANNTKKNSVSFSDFSGYSRF